MSAPVTQAGADPVETARRCWVAALAEACRQTSQSQVARQLGRSASLVNQVLQAKYGGNLRAVEDLVRGALMAATVDCPALGRLPSHECRGWMGKAKASGSTNALRVRMYRACRACPRYRNGGEE